MTPAEDSVNGEAGNTDRGVVGMLSYRF